LARMGTYEAASLPIVTSNLKVRLEANDLSSYPGSGSAWNNIAGESYDGTLLNSPTYNVSNGGWFLFDGTDDSVLIGESTTDWRMTATPITLQVWAYLETLGASGVLGKQSNSFASDGYAVAFNATGELRVSTNSQNISKTFFTPASTIVSQTWQLITVVLSLSNAAGSVKAYRNNALLINETHGLDSYDESNSLILGRGFQRGSPPETYMNGRIGAFYAYDRELTAQEISNNFNATRRRYGV